MKTIKPMVVPAVIFILAGCFASPSAEVPVTPVEDPEKVGVVVQENLAAVEKIDFANLDTDFLFSGDISDAWEAEYVPETDAINIFDPTDKGDQSLEKSQIFIRQFQADDFLTLSTVTIFGQTSEKIGQRDAVLYDIEKKTTVEDFAGQPSWRSQRHKVLDIRFSPASPSIFYVFSYNPDLDEGVFRAFIKSLTFVNDTEISATNADVPLLRASERISKKPFGILIDPITSPVQPERFSGYHSGTDFEVFDDEINSVVNVYSICSGRILTAQEVSGYGGVITQECVIDGENVRILYGHISLENTSVVVGQNVNMGENITQLGRAHSDETDGERKHLHLGITKGQQVDIRGYVQVQNDLNRWRNFESLE